MLLPGTAHADFHLCNNTGQPGRHRPRLQDPGKAPGSRKGWWNLSARSCETVLKGTLVARYYYIYAIDYDRGGEWSGQAFMCTRDKEFTIQAHAGLPGARLRQDRLLRGRYWRAAHLDGATHRNRREPRRSVRR